MPIGGKCDHRNCDGGPCKMLTPDELEPEEEDLIDAAHWIAEGWHSTSVKYRNISKFKEPVPKIEDMVSPEVLATFHGRRLKDRWERNHSSDLRSCEGIDNLELTVKQYKAFKKLGGPTA